MVVFALRSGADISEEFLQTDSRVFGIDRLRIASPPRDRDEHGLYTAVILYT